MLLGITMKKISINLYKLIYCLFFTTMLLFAFYPEYFNEIPIINKTDIFINLALASIVTLWIFKYHKSNLMFLYISLYVAYTFAITMIHHGNIANAIWGNGILLLALIWGTYKGYKKNPKLFEKTIYILMYVLIIINLFTVFIFPDGLITDSRGIRGTNFFLGNYNSYIQYILLTLIFGYLYHMRNKKSVTLGWFCIFGIGFLFYSQKFSATSTFGLGFLFIYQIIFNKKWTRMFMNLRIYTIGNALFFLIFVWAPTNGGILTPILNLIRKDLTFTGRTDIWLAVKEIIFSSHYLGIGMQDGENIAERIGMVQAINAHNLYLNILLILGVGGVIITVIMYAYTVYCLNKIVNEKVRYFLETILGVLMFMAQFEAYSMKFILYLMMLFCLYAEKDIQHNQLGDGTYK